MDYLDGINTEMVGQVVQTGIDLLNGMKPKNVPDFYLILDKITY